MQSGGDASVKRSDRSVLDSTNVVNELALRHYTGVRWSMAKALRFTPAYSVIRAER
jgi:hypothetical protein